MRREYLLLQATFLAARVTFDSQRSSDA